MKAKEKTQVPQQDPQTPQDLPNINPNPVKAIKKLTAKTVLGSIKVSTEKKALYLIYGIVSGRKQMTTDAGPVMGYTGTFEAVRARDGAKFSAPLAVLPGCSDGPFGSTQYVGNGPQKFAFEIFGQAHVSNGWLEFSITDLVTLSDFDPLTAIRAEVEDVLKTR